MPGTRTVRLKTEYEIKRDQEQHRKRLQEIRGNIDNSTPESLMQAKQRSHSPAKINANKAKQDEIARQNLQLAKRIFNIMEGDGALAERMHESDKVESHPGTMNFTHRLKEAQKIHEENMILAARLDNIQGYYRKADLTVVGPHKKKQSKKKKTKKTRFAQELAAVMKDKHGNQIDYTSRSDQTGNSRSRGRQGASGPGSSGGGGGGYNPESSSISRNRSTGGDSSAGNSQSSTSRSRPQNVLLEYTKIQNGKVLDVAVMKEPFRDRYAIFGIDIDEGQRYELKVTSEEVSNILDGDMLVTSVENVEVWMALLNKVSLNIVDQFSKLSSSQADLDSVSSSGAERGATTAERPNSNLQAMRPVRPSSEHKTTRFGDGHSRSGRSMVTTPITEQNENGDEFVGTPATASFPINAMNDDGEDEDGAEGNFLGDYIETARPFSAPRKADPANDTVRGEDSASGANNSKNGDPDVVGAGGAVSGTQVMESSDKSYPSVPAADVARIDTDSQGAVANPNPALDNEEKVAVTNSTARPGSSVGARPFSSSATVASATTAAAVDKTPKTTETDSTTLPIISSDSQKEEEEASRKIARLFKSRSPQKDRACQGSDEGSVGAATVTVSADGGIAVGTDQTSSSHATAPSQKETSGINVKTTNTFQSPSVPPKKANTDPRTPRPPMKTAKAVSSKKWYDDDTNAVNPVTNSIKEQDDEEEPSIKRQTQSTDPSVKKQPIAPSAPSSSRGSSSTKGGTYSGRYGTSSKTTSTSAAKDAPSNAIPPTSSKGTTHKEKESTPKAGSTAAAFTKTAAPQSSVDNNSSNPSASNKAQPSPREAEGTKAPRSGGVSASPASSSSKYTKGGGAGASKKGGASFKPSAPSSTTQSNSPRSQQYSSASSKTGSSSSKTAKLNVSLAYSVPASAGGGSSTYNTPTSKSSKNKSSKDKQQQQQHSLRSVHSPRTMEQLRALAQQTVEDSVDAVIESMTTPKQTVDESTESVVQ